MQIRRLAILTILASTLAIGTAAAQETDDAQAERPRPDREKMSEHRKQLSEEERAAMRERWKNMSEEDRQAARDKMRQRRAGKDGQRPQGLGGKTRQGERPANAGTDDA